jgi:hypothetical protein
MKNFSLTETEDKSQEDGNKEKVALFHVVLLSHAAESQESWKILTSAESVSSGVRPA